MYEIPNTNLRTSVYVKDHRIYVRNHYTSSCEAEEFDLSPDAALELSNVLRTAYHHAKVIVPINWLDLSPPEG